MCIGSYSTCVLHGIVQSQEPLKSINKQIEGCVDRERAAIEVMIEALYVQSSFQHLYV